MRWTLAIAMVLAAPWLAGCSDADPPGPQGLPASALEAGRYYAFQHNGGALAFTLDGQGETSFELYGSDDQRIGGAGLASSAAQQGLHRISGVAPGSIVLRVLTLTGTLQVESGGTAVSAFLPLLTSTQRIPLVALPPSNDPLATLGLGVLPVTGERFNQDVGLQLDRAPADLRVLASGPWSNLSVVIEGTVGRMVTASGSGSSPPSLLGDARELRALPGAATPQNLRAGNASARIQADALEGAVVLEVETFSRASLPIPGKTGPTGAFSYGALPLEPVAFTVHPRAKTLSLWQASGATSPAHVALFGPHDEPYGVLRVPPTGALAVAIRGAGEYVAVRLDGNVSLGADRTPAAFDLRPLPVKEAILPQQVAGSNGRYALVSETPTPTTWFALDPAQAIPTAQGITGGLQFAGCDGGRLLQVRQGNETLVSVLDETLAADRVQAFSQGTLARHAGDLTIIHDGFGDDGCTRQAVRLRSYERIV